MATTITLEGAARTEFGKGAARRMRVANLIPATVYAGGEEPVFVQLPMKETTLSLRHTNALFTIKFGDETKMAVVKDVQRNPVKRIVEHVDFYEVNDQKPITIGIPVKLTGLAQGVRDGGRMNLSIRKINVTAPYHVIPEHLDIDVTELKIGKSIKVGDLSFEGLELATSKAVVVCSIKMTRNAQLAAQAADDAEA